MLSLKWLSVDVRFIATLNIQMSLLSYSGNVPLGSWLKISPSPLAVKIKPLFVEIWPVFIIHHHYRKGHLCVCWFWPFFITSHQFQAHHWATTLIYLSNTGSSNLDQQFLSSLDASVLGEDNEIYPDLSCYPLDTLNGNTPWKLHITTLFWALVKQNASSIPKILHVLPIPLTLGENHQFMAYLGQHSLNLLDPAFHL